MKRFLCYKSTVILALVFLLTASVVSLWWVDNRTEASKYYPADLAQRGYFDIATDGGVVTLGNKSTTEAFEAQVDLVQDANSSMSISYDLGKEVAPVVENDLVKWKNESQEVFFKQIPAGTSSSQTVPHASNKKQFRYIPLGKTSLSQFVSSYELFGYRQSTTPTITTFVPNENGFVFYGRRTAETDLIDPSDITSPITRIAADDDDISCPVISVTEDGLIASFIYYPHIGSKKEVFIGALTEALNNLLEERGVTSKVLYQADSFYYMNGIQPVALGRVAGDTHHVGFYLYIDSPYDSQISHHLRERVTILDTVLKPYGSLRDLDDGISVHILDELMQRFAANVGMELQQDELTVSESDDLTALGKFQKQKTWVVDAVRVDNDMVRDYDRFEFDILLHQKPSSSIFTYQIDTENLHFTKNNPPTDEELEDGVVVNVESIGSYTATRKAMHRNAFLQADVKHHFAEAFTLYRPKVIDAKGEWQWAELEIDEERGELRVIVDDAFMQQAHYPVIVDPTFGVTAYHPGSTASSSFSEDRIRVLYAQGSPGYILSISAVFWSGISEGHRCSAALYEGVARQHLASTIELDPSEVYVLYESAYESDLYMVTFPFSEPVAISGSLYGLAVQCDERYSIGKEQHLSLFSLASSGQFTSYRYPGYPYENGWPELLNLGEFMSGYELFIYATYTESLPSDSVGDTVKFGGGTKFFGGSKIVH